MRTKARQGNTQKIEFKQIDESVSATTMARPEGGTRSYVTLRDRATFLAECGVEETVEQASRAMLVMGWGGGVISPRGVGWEGKTSSAESTVEADWTLGSSHVTWKEHLSSGSGIVLRPSRAPLA